MNLKKILLNLKVILIHVWNLK